MHNIGNVIIEIIVLKNIIPVAHCSSPPYFVESNAVVTGVGIPAIITVIPRSIGSIFKNDVKPKTIAEIPIKRTNV